MLAIPGKLSRKIIGMLMVFFLVAASAIGLTLLISWQLEGVAAAINDAGSQRMRSYRMAHLMARGLEAMTQETTAAQVLGAERVQFERVLHDLQQGDPERPLSSPRNPEVQQRLQAVDQIWYDTMLPRVATYLGGARAERELALDQFDSELEGFVSTINELVLAMERSYSADTHLLRTVQAALMVLAIFGTVILIRYFSRLVIRPVGILHAGMQRMTGDDLTVRLPVTSDDELGRVADGFNQMAERLQDAYATLEQRVEAETRRLAERNHELGILYSVTTFLSESAPIEVLSQGFLERIVGALGADAAAVRMFEPPSEQLCLATHQGLPADFLSREAAMPGENAAWAPFATALAFSIQYDKQMRGVYNLYFRRSHVLSAQEVHLLETLGHHLGVAIENQRLKSRETELAVSEERNLLAQELHDSIAQGLAFLNIQVQLLQDSLRKGKLDEAMQTAGQLREGVQESYDDVRELLVHFRTRVHQSDLDTAIQSTLEKFEGQTGIATEFERIGNASAQPATDEIQIMHIVQESLSNVRKHAAARHVRVSIRRDVGGVRIDVVDDGVGFDPVSDPNCLSDRHVGLRIMRERAHRIGGECRITSTPGSGTRVTLTLPNTLKEEMA